MAAPVQPEQSGQPGQGRVIPRASQSPTTPATNGQPAPSTEGQQPTQPGASVTPPAPTEPTREQKLIAAQEQVLREQQQELTRLRQTQRGIETRVQAIESPAPSREDFNRQFWQDPMSIVDTLKAELAKTVEPINQYISGQRTETQYDRLKIELKSQFSDVWPHIEREVDRFVEAAAGAGNEVNAQLLNVAALAATGAFHRGLLGDNSSLSPAPPAPPAPTPPASPAQPRADMTTPPHLRPSAPTPPGHEQPQKPPTRELSENEKRLARERSMTPEQFLSWIEVPPDQVVHSKIGRAQP